MKMFFVAGIGIAVFFEFLLIAKKNKSVSDQILSLWMFLILVHLFLLFINVTGDIFDYPFLLGLEQPLPLLQGVFLYFYISFLTQQLPENKRLLLFHLVPAAVLYLYLGSFFFLPSDQKIEIYRQRGAGHELFMQLKSYAISCSGVFYVTWSGILLRRHRKRVREEFSDLKNVNLQWLRILTFGIGGIWVLVIFFRSELLVMGGMVVFIYLIAFFGVRQANIFAPVHAGGDVAEEKKKYQKTGLTEEASGKLHQELIRLMTEEALYKKSDLSINDLSSRLGVHPNYLSQIINQREQKNFYDFVNTYRIEEFRRLVAMPRNRQFTLLSLAQDCGFSSKSSFNRYFKKATGQTPSEYSSALNKETASL